MITEGRLGEKSGAGFYKRVGKEIHTLDWRTGEYQPQTKPASPDLDRLSKLALAERFAAIRGWADAGSSTSRHKLLLVRATGGQLPALHK